MTPFVEAITGSIKLALPEAVLILSACLLFLVGPFVPVRASGGRHQSRNLWGGWAALTLLLALVVWLLAADVQVSNLAASAFRQDLMASFVRGLGLAAGGVLLLLSWDQFRDEVAAECHACLLLILAGVLLVGAANDLVTLFLALELVSIPTYILLYLVRQDVAAQEATVKYFLLSIFSSALFLYGLSFFFGSIGTTNLEIIQITLRGAKPIALPSTLVIAVLMVLAGLGFRITAVPFHFYAPDVFQGTQTTMAALLAFVPKLAGFIALLRLLGPCLPAETLAGPAGSVAGATTVLLWVVAILTMFLGNFLALLQDNLKRLLAYSSVAHAGYMLVGLATVRTGGETTNALGAQSLLFYLAAYGAMTLGAFALIIHLDRPGNRVETVDDLAGLGQNSPGAALLMALFMFSLTGLPPTAGFWGKLYIFIAAWSEGSPAFRLLALLMAINAAIGGWYYLRVVGVMYLRPATRPAQLTTLTPGWGSVLICAFATAGLFIAPDLLWRLIAPVTT